MFSKLYTGPKEYSEPVFYTIHTQVSFIKYQSQMSSI